LVELVGAALVAFLGGGESEHTHRVLASCDGNSSDAARLLGVHRRSLQRKVAKYPVRP
jgi:two-component system response regulator RegA